MGTRTRVNTNEPSTKPGEEDGVKKEEQVAAEQPIETAEETNPVGEATQRESKDPYAEGKHIANPEPNNRPRGAEDDEDQAVEEAQADQDAQADVVQAQEERQVDPAGAKADASK